jgi:hypothetical protein
VLDTGLGDRIAYARPSAKDQDTLTLKLFDKLKLGSHGSLYFF